MPSPRRRSLLLLVAAAALAAPARALASPHPLPFTYPYQTVPAEALEAEQYVDLVPMRVMRELPDGTAEGVVGVRSLLQTELEYGITDRLEAAIYFAFQQGGAATAPALQFKALKQRLHYRFAESGAWPVDVGVYLELAEASSELEAEEKLLVSRRFGAVSVAANLWVEQEWYFQTRETKHIYNPTIGATYEFSPRLSIGAEYWLRGRFDAARGPAMGEAADAPASAAHYAGPTLLLQASKLWLAVGAYARLDRLGAGTAVGDPYGKLWVRTIVGLDL